MKCDKCGKDTYVSKFHKPYANYCEIKQSNGFCYDCWCEIVEKYGTWMDICIKNAIKPYMPKQKRINNEYETIWLSSRKEKNI